MENKKLIGPCKDCGFWGEEFPIPEDAPPEAIPELKGLYRHCDHEESPCMATPANYGCIYWKEKGDSQDKAKNWNTVFKSE